MSLVQNKGILFACFIPYSYGQEKIMPEEEGGRETKPDSETGLLLPSSVRCACTGGGSKNVRHHKLRLQRLESGMRALLPRNTLQARAFTV